jgi:hypothetical protein
LTLFVLAAWTIWVWFVLAYYDAEYARLRSRSVVEVWRRDIEVDIVPKDMFFEEKGYVFPREPDLWKGVGGEPKDKGAKHDPERLSGMDKNVSTLSAYLNYFKERVSISKKLH